MQQLATVAMPMEMQKGEKTLFQRQIEKARAKTIKDTYFLINWLEEEEDDLFDVVPSKSVVPPEGTTIFDISTGSICRVSFSSQYYKAKIVNQGTNKEMKRLQKDLEQKHQDEELLSKSKHDEIAEVEDNPDEDYITKVSNVAPELSKTKKSKSNHDYDMEQDMDSTPEPSQVLNVSLLDSLFKDEPIANGRQELSSRVKKSAVKKSNMKTSKVKKSKSKECPSTTGTVDLSGEINMESTLNISDSLPASVHITPKSSHVSRDRHFTTKQHDIDDDDDQASEHRDKSKKRLHFEAEQEWQRRRFLQTYDEAEESQNLFDEVSSKRPRLESYQALTCQVDKIFEKIEKLEDSNRRLQRKIKTQAVDIKLLQAGQTSNKSSPIVNCVNSPRPAPSPDDTPEVDLSDDVGNVQIHGRLVDRLKLQSAKLHSDPSKCALQLMGCLFSTEEMVNGNPSGVTKSKDSCRKKTIKKLDFNKIQYIHDYIESKWPGSYQTAIKKMT